MSFFANERRQQLNNQQTDKNTPLYQQPVPQPKDERVPVNEEPRTAPTQNTDSGLSGTGGLY